eukprot:3316454-Pleurochrysis_carterae.AAC.2
MRFLDASPDPFHACANVRTKLLECGYVELDEAAVWSGKLQNGGKYFFTRNRSCIVAFAVGDKFEPGEGGFKVIGAHTDSPNLKVKPRSKLKDAAGCTQLDIECYGGGLWHTWFDRDLSVSGRVVVREGDRLTQKLVKVDTPLLRVPTLCIHLQTAQVRRDEGEFGRRVELIGEARACRWSIECVVEGVRTDGSWVLTSVSDWAYEYEVVAYGVLRGC